MARRGTNTDGVCNGRAMAMSNGHQGISLRAQPWRKQNLPRPPLYTPRWIIERTPLIFLMVVMAQSPATSNGTIDFNDHPRPMLSPSATSSNGSPKAVHWPLFFFYFSVFFFPTFQEENLSVLTLPKEPKDQDVVIQVWNWTVSPPFAPNNTPVSANQSNPSPVATVDPSPVPPSKLELYVRSWSRSKRL